MPQTFTLKQRIALAVVPRLASMAIRCLGVTLVTVTSAILEPFRLRHAAASDLCLLASLLLACAWCFRNGGVTILISRSFDGDLIARTVERLGFSLFEARAPATAPWSA